MMTRRLLVGALATVASGCYGQFALTRKLYEWNGSLGNKFLNTVVMWAFMIIPVYAVVSFVDLIVLNLVEFWTGSNPMATLQHDDGSQTRLTRLTPDLVRLERLVAGVVTHSIDLQRSGEGAVMALDQSGDVLRQAETLENGAIVAVEGPNRFEWSAAEVQRMSSARSVAVAVAQRLPVGALASR